MPCNMPLTWGHNHREQYYCSQREIFQCEMMARDSSDLADSILMLKSSCTLRGFNLVSKQNKLVWGKCFATEMCCVILSLLSPLPLQYILEHQWSIQNRIFMIRLSSLSYLSFAGNGNLTSLSPHMTRSLWPSPNPLQYSLLENTFHFWFGVFFVVVCFWFDLIFFLRTEAL